VAHSYPCKGPLYGESSFTELADSVALQTRLLRCDVCATLWEVMERAAWPVSRETAAIDFPGVQLSA
jgi:hypothetical protein